jgi:Asp-tRNA(Asn)/Glu-tRNA(Gln) amidotransferase A subunit family amidase
MDRSVAQLGTSIRRGELSASDVLAEHMQRIAAVNPGVNAIVTLAEEEASRAAQSIDEDVRQGRDPGPLAGVPFTVKDIIATAGIRTTAGSRALATHVPRRSATAVDRLLRAGAVMVGKSNCPEFAMDVHTRNELFGETRNPVHPGRTPGGSSGGDSAAVAAGMVAFGLGTDYGGSIRWPAHCTGLVALRPTAGLVPGTGILPPPDPDDELSAPNFLSAQAQLQTIAPIARRACDLWPILRVIAGRDEYDSKGAPAVLGDPSAVHLEDVGVAWCDGDGSYPVRDDLVSAVQRAAGHLAAAGARTQRRRPPGLETAEQIYASLRDAEGLPDHRRFVGDALGQVSAPLRAALEDAAEAPLSVYRDLAARRDALRARVLAFMRQSPVLLMPVACLPAFEADTTDVSLGGSTIPRMNVVTCCRVISLLGLPAAVVPVGRSDDGLSIGVQVVGRPYADHEVLAVACAIERAEMAGGDDDDVPALASGGRSQ